MGTSTASVEIPEPPGFEKLSKTEQIRYVQGLWDRISQRLEEVPVLPSHVELAEARLAAHRRNPEAAKPASDVI
ncbi:MAG: addiction module protein, partial [Candidatus Binatia bacterium]